MHNIKAYIYYLNYTEITKAKMKTGKMFWNYNFCEIKVVEVIIQH